MARCDLENALLAKGICTRTFGTAHGFGTQCVAWKSTNSMGPGLHLRNNNQRRPDPWLVRRREFQQRRRGELWYSGRDVHPNSIRERHFWLDYANAYHRPDFGHAVAAERIWCQTVVQRPHCKVTGLIC